MREQRRAEDEHRGTSAERGYGARWRAYALAYLRAHPLCALHYLAGRIVAATVVDHIVPHKGDLALFWDPANHQALCASCHGRKSATEPGGRAHVSDCNS